MLDSSGRTDNDDCSTSRMISSFSAAAYLTAGRGNCAFQKEGRRRGGRPRVSTSGDNAFRCDWLPEQGGLETSVSRETFAKENPRGYWRNFASKSVGILQRVSSPSVRYEFRP